MKHTHGHRYPFLKAGGGVLISLALVLVTIALPVSAGGPGGKDAFRKGKAVLEHGLYADAVTHLTLARQEFGILADYALLYIADAHHNLGEHAKALDAIRSLLRQYPSSVLKKKARMAEIREAMDCGEEPLALYAAYVRDFPDDDEAQFTYGRLLKKNDRKAEATAIFRKLFIRAGNLASSAYAEFAAEEISSRDILERTSNLMKQYNFEEAERELRQALSRCTGNERQELLKNLAYALFRQKKYREAADAYDKVNDTYFEARSLYRAGDKKGFWASLQTLTRANNKKAGPLLITVAADKRREKDFEGALQTYQEVLRNYPADAEDALWGIGWTHHLSGDFRKSAEAFSQLYASYNDPKYLYWQARSTEAAGQDASNLYQKVMAEENNFYAVLVYAKYRRPVPRTASSSPVPPGMSGEKSQSYERVEALLSLDMKSEAIMELTAICRQLSSPSDLLFSASAFQGLGEFNRAISLVTKIPYSEKLHRFWYPLAFWDSVEQAAVRNSIDPYLILSVMREESRFDQTIKSPAGAYGLMQLMPQTAYRLDRSLNLGIRRPAQLIDPKSNISLGSYYLKALSDEFRSLPHVLAAYNAGELAVRSWQQRFVYRAADEFIEDIPYAETRNYVKKVITSYFQYKRGATTTGAEENYLDGLLGTL